MDFFIRYLAQEAGLAINTLGSLDATPHPDRLNLVYTEDGFGAGDLFAAELKSGKNRLAGCVTWEPKVSEVVEGSGGKAHVLTTNRNLLIVADVMILHRGFAEQHPQVVEGLVRGLLEGNRMVRDRPDAQLDVIGRAFKWTRDDTKAELAKVHLSNLPENRAFFSGAIDAAGSFGGIYQSAVLAYGSDLIKDPPDAGRFVDTKHARRAREERVLQGADGRDRADPQRRRRRRSRPIRSSARTSGSCSSRTRRRSIWRTRTTSRTWTRSSGCCRSAPARRCCCAGMWTTRRSPTSGGRAARRYVRTQALRAMELSKNRAAEIRRLLIERYSGRPEAPRHRRARLGRALGLGLGQEPPRRSAVVHDRVNAAASASSSAGLQPAS